MALKPHRDEGHQDISFFMNVTGEPGMFVTFKTSGSGAAMDQSDAVVEVPTGGVSGTKPAGLLLERVVNNDLTRLPLNTYKSELQVGSKVPLMVRGWVVTNRINGSPTAGDTAYYNSSGNLQPTLPTNGTAVGRFLSSPDEDGYAKVEINL